MRWPRSAAPAPRSRGARAARWVVASAWAAALPLASFVRAGEVHRWVDAEGRTHISDSQSAPQPSKAPADARNSRSPSDALPSDRGTATGSTATGPYREGLLWKVEPPSPSGSGVASSYVFGTMHSGDPRVRAISPATEEAFRGARTFCAEASLDGAALLAVGQRMFLSEGRSLDQILGKPLYDRVVPLLEERGLPAGFVPMLAPWVVLLTLGIPTSVAADGAGTILDFELMQRAQEAGKEICALETMEEQVGSVEKIPEADQVKQIRAAVDSAAGLDQVYRKAVDLYAREDLAGLGSLERGVGAEGKRLERELAIRLVDDRNIRMASRMSQQVDRGGAFIAVGAGHLGGERGVLALLAERGYRIARASKPAR